MSQYKKKVVISVTVIPTVLQSRLLRSKSVLVTVFLLLCTKQEAQLNLIELIIFILGSFRGSQRNIPR